MTSSKLITYLKSNGCIVKGKGGGDGEEPQELTHTLMNGASGGKIAVHEAAIDGFFAAYGEDLARGHELYVIERRSEVFNMHLDCDFKQRPSDQSLRTFVAAAHAAVAKYFGNEPEAARCIACAVLAEDGTTRKAPGIHLMFPHAPVNEAAALWIRAGVVHALSGLRGFEDEDWSTVIDICVLTTAGLRMVGSDKCKTCPACCNTAENRPFCAACAHKGKVAENKIYWPHLAWPEDDGEIQESLAQAKANPAHAARLCSTRKPKGTPVHPSFSVPPGAPPCATKKRARWAAGGDGARDRIYVLSENDGPDLSKGKSSTRA